MVGVAGYSMTDHQHIQVLRRRQRVAGLPLSLAEMPNGPAKRVAHLTTIQHPREPRDFSCDSGDDVRDWPRHYERAFAVEENAALVDARLTPPDAVVDDRRMVGADVTRRCSLLHARAIAVEENAALVDARLTPPDAVVDDRRMELDQEPGRSSVESVPPAETPGIWSSSVADM
ncbi:hypothetical protein HPB48_003960 [Haemaphysalis longicornis]|uniref:Uncharacterized protein n=1 Tax=Haemaphysalis longicornis TaxID=44386 RepID=A0A9J6GBU0_HAELO|nr:hypothetical protein HPB48_003960 [Haemaphysalis longicornis]